MRDTPKTDPIDAAIAAAEAPVPVPMRTAQIGLLNQPHRPAVISVPEDITDLEWLAFISAVLQVGDALRAQRPASRIFIPPRAHIT